MSIPRFSSLCRRYPLSSTTFPPPPPLSSLHSAASRRFIRLRAAFDGGEEPPSETIHAMPPAPSNSNRWKPLCLYYSQNRCTMVDDPVHIDKFNHDFGSDLVLDVSVSQNLRPQEHDYFLVLDLEGKVEILEFPVLLVDAKTLNVVDIFHRFVRPSVMSEARINQYIEGKYGKIGVDRVWHDTAIPFNEVISQFEEWLGKHQLWMKHPGGYLNEAAFVTCGNWDLKTKIPEQCVVAKITLPSYFMEWINLKDVYLNFYKRRAPGMVSMMKQLGIRLVGSHHLGIDDTKNIARVLQHMILEGAVLQISARRLPGSPEKVKFMFENRV